MEPYVTAENIESKAQAWLERIRPYNQHEMRLNVAASALLVVDMQRFFLDPASPTFTCGGVAILPTVKRLIDAFRRAGRPVIFTRHVHHPGDLDSGIMGWWWEGKCLEGSPESEIHPELGSDARRESRVQAPILGLLQHGPGDRAALPESGGHRGLRDHDQHVLRIDGAGCVLPGLPGVLPGGWNRVDQRGDAPCESLEPRVRFCVRDDQRTRSRHRPAKWFIA